MNNKHRYFITNGCCLNYLKSAIEDFKQKTLLRNLIKAMIQ